MSIQTINLGSYANDGTGDDLRTAFQKVNANFAELGGAVNISNGTNIGTGVGLFAQRNVANLEFKTLTSTDDSVTITSTANSVNLKSNPKLVNDTSPTLGGNLNLNDHYIYGGDTHTTVWGWDVPTLAGVLQLLIQSNQTLSFDFGSFLLPTEIDLDMNGINNIGFLDSASNTFEIDLGTF